MKVTLLQPNHWCLSSHTRNFCRGSPREPDTCTVLRDPSKIRHRNFGTVLGSQTARTRDALRDASALCATAATAVQGPSDLSIAKCLRYRSRALYRAGTGTLGRPRLSRSGKWISIILSSTWRRWHVTAAFILNLGLRETRRGRWQRLALDR